MTDKERKALVKSQRATIELLAAENEQLKEEVYELKRNIKILEFRLDRETSSR